MTKCKSTLIHKNTNKETDKELREVVILNPVFYTCSVILALLHYSYPPHFTVDSGWYLFLSNVISENNWSAWSPIRNIIFPLLLNISTSFLGHNNNALSFLMFVSYLILTYTAILFCKCIIDLRFPGNQKLLNIFIIIIFILYSRPIIMGYYHLVLTEFLAASIAIVSCYTAYKLYVKFESLRELSIKDYWKYFVYFLLIVPFSWHIKQAYVTATIIPLILSSFLIIVKIGTLKTFLTLTIINISTVTILLASIVGWSSFIKSFGLESSLSALGHHMNIEKTTMVQNKITSKLNEWFNAYLAIANVYYFNQFSSEIEKEFSLIRGGENKSIAYVIYDWYGISNIREMPEVYYANTEQYLTYFLPPIWFDSIQDWRIVLDNFIFTTLNLLNPFLFISSFLLFLRTKKLIFAILVICLGTALINLLAHIILVAPIDRYIFLGYPLLIISLVVMVLQFLLPSKRYFIGM